MAFLSDQAVEKNSQEEPEYPIGDFLIATSLCSSCIRVNPQVGFSQ
jgi:hypothetical protein